MAKAAQKKIARKQIGRQRPSRGEQMRLDEGREAEILDIAAEVFINQGFEGASTNEIARRANASKTTFYSRFPSKEKLFMAVLKRRMDAVFSDVAAALPLDPPVENTLRDFGAHLLRSALSKDQLALLRMVSMESKRFPKLGAYFYELGPKRGLAHLSRYLQEQINRRRLVKGDPALMAEHLSSLLTAGPARWAVLGLRNHLGTRGHRQRVEAAVKVFLRAYAVHKA